MKVRYGWRAGDPRFRRSPLTLSEAPGASFSLPLYDGG
jgi:hypothetical protein